MADTRSNSVCAAAKAIPKVIALGFLGSRSTLTLLSRANSSSKDWGALKTAISAWSPRLSFLNIGMLLLFTVVILGWRREESYFGALVFFDCNAARRSKLCLDQISALL